MSWPTITINTHLGQFESHDDFQAKLLCTNGYELEVEFIARKVCKTGMKVANIGANIGWFARMMSNLVGPSGTVYAIEPHPDNVALLRQNTNGNVVIHECAVGLGSYGPVPLHEHPVNSGEHSLLLDVEDIVTVASVDIKTILPPEKLDFVIVDTQGFDYFVMAALGEERRPDTAVVEFWQDGADSLGMTKDEVFALYRQMGYRVTPCEDDMNVLLSKGEH